MCPPSTPARTVAQRAGDAAESLAAERLIERGWTILGRQVRIGRKEIDLIALDPGPPPCLVLVEVRWRASRDFGLGEETFDWRKRAHLRAALGRLVETGELPDGRRLPVVPTRIDLIVVEPGIRTGSPPRIRHHRDALA